MRDSIFFFPPGRRGVLLRLQARSGCRWRAASWGDVVQFPNVFLKIKVPAETLAACRTGERLLVVVRVHVKCEVVHLVEGFVADIALELFFSAVGQFVVFVVSLN